MFRPHPNISDAWILSKTGELEPPITVVLAALHGNERCGVAAIESVRRDPAPFVERQRSGSVVFVHGNPRATEQRRRYTHAGTDINRLFSYAYVDTLAREAWTYEHERALELRPLITGADALLDIHSASQPTPPFVICDGSPEAVRIGSATGFKVTYGWDGPGMLMDQVSIGSLVSQGKPAVSVECGQHEAPSTMEYAHAVLDSFLVAIGALSGGLPHTEAEVYRLFARLVKPTHDFVLARDFASFERLDPGESLGSGPGLNIVIEREAYLLLPTPSAERGEDIVYLAERVS
ncbi:MAG: succinylglutamate desuccinylase/aspartoacylase family protein [Myxococcales bacterium]|nr:succinylglutamate desuccinylase/aspartoacylase family protein [Myxococcales bacterium]